MQKKFAIAFAAAILSTSLTACSGAGNDAPTRMINQVTDGVEANLASEGNLIYLRNIYVAVNAAGDASLVGTIVNQKPTQDALVAVAVNQVSVKIVPQAALQNKPIIFGGDSANAEVVLPAAGLIAGHRVPVSFFFGLAGSVSVDALVVNA
jgi:hypothetical protein